MGRSIRGFRRKFVTKRWVDEAGRDEWIASASERAPRACSLFVRATASTADVSAPAWQPEEQVWRGSDRGRHSGTGAIRSAVERGPGGGPLEPPGSCRDTPQPDKDAFCSAWATIVWSCCGSGSGPSDRRCSADLRRVEKSPTREDWVKRRTKKTIVTWSNFEVTGRRTG